MNNNKVVLITGGVSGIGRSISIQLAREGYSVYATTRKINSSSVQELNTLSATEGLDITPIYLDLAKSESIISAISEIIKKKNKIDILINNAASGYFSSVEDINRETFMHQMDVNIFGVVQVIQAVLPQMRAQKSGKIINISSIMGFSTAPLNAPYSAGKYALESISETLALEVNPFGIDVVILQLGDFHSDFLKNSLRFKYIETSPYYKLYKRQDDRIISGGIGKDPTMVAKKIIQICAQPHPALRYMLGKEVFIRKFLHHILFDGLWIRFLRFFYKW